MQINPLKVPIGFNQTQPTQKTSPAKKHRKHYQGLQSSILSMEIV
jgi:hypothetical protein